MPGARLGGGAEVALRGTGTIAARLTGASNAGWYAISVLPAGYTSSMAKVMVSIPDDLLGALDAEAHRQGTSRSALLQRGARRELGLLRRERHALLTDLEELSSAWGGPVDAAALVRVERQRNG